MNPASILIFEDEVYTYRLLRHQLLDINPAFDIIGPVTTVEEGRVFLSYHHDIDIIIADIQLNDGLSFEALGCASPDVPIIFTTAYDEYALKAFKYNSLSYLLKPVDEDELRQALVKALHNAPHYDASPPGKGDNVYENLAHDGSHRHCFLVRTTRGERRVHVSMIRYIVSENKTTYIHLLDGTSYPIDITLAELSAQLDQKLFMRVNRKFIIPIEQVRGQEHLPNGRMRILLYGDALPEILVSRIQRNAVVRWMQG